MENVEFNLECLKTIDTKQGAVRAVRFNGKFDATTLTGTPSLEYVSFPGHGKNNQVLQSNRV
jgi:hypothetical protein